MPAHEKALYAFAEEAETQYRRLAEFARSLGVESAAEMLGEKAGWMRTILDDRDSAERPSAEEQLIKAEALSEARPILVELQQRLQAALENWPPDGPEAFQQLARQVGQAADRMASLSAQRTHGTQAIKKKRRRWGAEPPAATEPPIFRPPTKR
ncbi:MAG: hypothetical protein AB7S38_26225 [Vulcanimicrobiota bacterium]